MLNWWLKKKLIKKDIGSSVNSKNKIGRRGKKVTLPMEISNHLHVANNGWSNSICTYNKEYIKCLIHNSPIINYLIQKVSNWDKICSFFENYRFTIKKHTIKKRTKSRPYITKYNIFSSKAYTKHINKNALITFSTYNSIIKTFNKKLIKKRFRLLKLGHNMIYKFRKGLKSLSKIKNINNKYIIFFYLLYTLLIRKKNSYLKKGISYLTLKKKIILNRYRFEQFFTLRKPNLLYLIEHVFDKEVAFNIMDLKLKHLNSDILSDYIVTRLKNRDNRILRVLKRSISKVRIMPIHLYLIKYNDIHIFKSNILNYIKYKAIGGVRLEGRGRLTRRLTASRSIFKFKYKGSLKNIDSSYREQSSRILRGHIKSNLQYTIINSKTRNGAFGLRSWVSSY